MIRKKIVLTKPLDRANVKDTDRWVPCPVCGKKRLFHLLPQTRGQNIPVFCRQCRQEIVIDIDL